MISGIKGYENRLKNCRKNKTRIHRTAKESSGTRRTKKLTAKSSWFRKKKTRKLEEGANTGEQNKSKKRTSTKPEAEENIKTRSVLFVEATPHGELASRLRELLKRLEPTMKFRVKVVERTGATLRSQFPLTRLCEGVKCGRLDCTTCEQGVEELPPCTRNSVVYENICKKCNPTATKKGSLKDYRGHPIPLCGRDIPQHL